MHLNDFLAYCIKCKCPTQRGLSRNIKATSWSTNGDITDAHISATIQQILTKFSAVVSYVKHRQIGKFQLICT